MTSPLHRSLHWLLWVGLAHATAAQEYFQQQVDHVIHVTLDDRSHTLHGHGTFTYHNHAPTVLDTIWVHLWPNAYSQRSTALSEQLANNGDLGLYFAKPEDRGRIDSLDFHTGGTDSAYPLRWGHHARHPDIAWIALHEPLRPGATVRISTPFRVQVPSGEFSRLGHTGQAYYITQWYPKPAVFDKNGWHYMPYLSNGEFYNEFGEYDVTITLPANYVVGATGMLQNEEERTWMDSLATLPLPDDKRNTFPPSDTRTKTLRFVQDRVHDFAWFADKRFIVRKSQVEISSIFNTVTTWALFTPANAARWDRVAITSINESLRLFSEWVGPYRYEACTAVDGTISAGGGMEYPMITVIGDMGSDFSLDQVIAHEVGHNWFQGMLGSNERMHPWLDEGLNSFIELRYLRTRYPEASMGIGFPGMGRLLGGHKDPHRIIPESGYRLNARRNLDQALDLHSTQFTSINYGTMVYSKTALVLDQLHAYVGQERMDRAMQMYFEEWQYRHPGPADFRRSIERALQEDLNWFFDELVSTTHKVEVKPFRLKGAELAYRSNAHDGFPIPVTAWKDGKELGSTWLRTKNGRQSATLPWAEADKVRLDVDARTLDIDRRNNAVRAHGLFRRCTPPALRPLLGLERDDRRTIYFTPFVAWNGHDGAQAGIAAYNTAFPSQRTEWAVAPLYGVQHGRWSGGARIEHHFDRLQSRLFRNIHVGMNGRRATTLESEIAHARYEKLSPTLAFDLMRPLTAPWQHRVDLRTIHLFEHTEMTPADVDPVTASTQRNYAELRYTASDARKLHPSFIQPVITTGPDFVRASLELRQGFAYNDRADQLRLRGFFGTFFWKENNRISNPLHAWRSSWGAKDMLFDHAYLQRGSDTGTTARQFNKQQGAFKTPFVQGASDSWIVAINGELDLPVLPIALFGSMGRVPISLITPTGLTTSAANYFEAGVGLIAVNDVLEIWLPLVVSQRIADEEEFLGRSLGERIRFVLALEKVDPTKALRRLKP